MVSEEGQRWTRQNSANQFSACWCFNQSGFFMLDFSTNQVVSYGNFSQSVCVPMSFANQIRLATVSKYGFASDIVSQSILGEKISL